MNKLSSCEIFKMVDDNFKGSIMRTIQDISNNVDDYVIDPKYYDFMVKSMRSYKYPLSKLIVQSALDSTIRPLLLADPEDKSKQQIFLPSTISTFSTISKGYVDISPRGGYVRNKSNVIEALKIKEVDLYAYLQMSFLDLRLKQKSEVIDKSSVIAKNIAISYSRLFSRCVARTFPINANIEKFNVSLFLTSIFCLVKFFDYTIVDAINIVYSTGISSKLDMESDCKVLRENKLTFTSLSEFLVIYGYEFSEYIKEGSLNLRMMVNLFQKMYGANAWFAIEHAATFFNMILAVQVGFYNDKFISKTIKAQVDKIQAALVTILST